MIKKPIKKMMTGISIIAAALISTVGFAEDAVIADPAHYTVEFENDRVRIIRVKYGPGEKSVMHTHAANVSVLLSDGSVTMHMPDGTTENMPSKVGMAAWSDGDKHLPENTTGESLEVVLIELKD